MVFYQESLKILFRQRFVSLPCWESPRLVEVELPEPWTSFKGVGSVVCYLNNELGHLRGSDDQFGKRFFSWERPWMKQRHGGFLLVKRRYFILKNGWCLLWMGGGSFMSHQKDSKLTVFGKEASWELSPDISKFVVSHLWLPGWSCSILMFQDFQSLRIILHSGKLT